MVAPIKGLRLGERAPTFTLRDQHNNAVHLNELTGKRILLSFHPLAWTTVCAKQMKSLEKNQGIFKELNTVTVGISVDPAPSKNAWAKNLGIEETQLLSDFWPHGEVAKLYGIFREIEGFSERAHVIINENQAVAFCKIYEIAQVPDIGEIVNFLKDSH